MGRKSLQRRRNTLKFDGSFKSDFTSIPEEFITPELKTILPSNLVEELKKHEEPDWINSRNSSFLRFLKAIEIANRAIFFKDAPTGFIHVGFISENAPLNPGWWLVSLQDNGDPDLQKRYFNFKCNCPDYTNSYPGDPESSLYSKAPRTWHILDKPIMDCKHITASKLRIGIPVDRSIDQNIPADWAESMYDKILDALEDQKYEIIPDPLTTREAVYLVQQERASNKRKRELRNFKLGELPKSKKNPFGLR